MTEKYLIFNLDDEKSKKLGEVISNKTSRKIINLLVEKELGASEIAKELKIPLNTATYNLKKLIEAGLIEKSKNYFWSVKGKKMPNYKVVNKAIVVTPKKSNIYSKLKGVVPLILLSTIFTWFVLWMQGAGRMASSAGKKVLEKSDMVASTSGSEVNVNIFLNLPVYAWFLIGLWLVVVVFVIYSLSRR